MFAELNTGQMEKKEQSPLEKQVEENLRRVYRAKEEEAVPDRFVALLNQLRSQEEKGDK
ncbi:MAG: NepR family anti-sigma factor [Deltaproteobacteria bacterium]